MWSIQFDGQTNHRQSMFSFSVASLQFTAAANIGTQHCLQPSPGAKYGPAPQCDFTYQWDSPAPPMLSEVPLCVALRCPHWGLTIIKVATQHNFGSKCMSKWRQILTPPPLTYSSMLFEVTVCVTRCPRWPRSQHSLWEDDCAMNKCMSLISPSHQYSAVMH